MPKSIFSRRALSLLLGCKEWVLHLKESTQKLSRLGKCSTCATLMPPSPWLMEDECLRKKLLTHQPFKKWAMSYLSWRSDMRLKVTNDTREISWNMAESGMRLRTRKEYLIMRIFQIRKRFSKVSVNICLNWSQGLRQLRKLIRKSWKKKPKTRREERTRRTKISELSFNFT